MIDHNIGDKDGDFSIWWINWVCARTGRLDPVYQKTQTIFLSKWHYFGWEEVGMSSLYYWSNSIWASTWSDKLALTEYKTLVKTIKQHYDPTS